MTLVSGRTVVSSRDQGVNRTGRCKGCGCRRPHVSTLCAALGRQFVRRGRSCAGWRPWNCAGCGRRVLAEHRRAPNLLHLCGDGRRSLPLSLRRAAFMGKRADRRSQGREPERQGPRLQGTAGDVRLRLPQRSRRPAARRGCRVLRCEPATPGLVPDGHNR